ncbi:uncharacterized protein B0H64DRAFT_24525 [Chaetomium fimeti]|uniref:Secreted protein n=1 Tax=Chaetomium fimeti TaxID=1854472 RepID=A0AAE0HQG1_9PEZI|nr:hypothetical protein B0H64DRAFT_24525 [Chaetomium fimeti]
MTVAVAVAFVDVCCAVFVGSQVAVSQFNDAVNPTRAGILLTFSQSTKSNLEGRSRSNVYPALTPNTAVCNGRSSWRRSSPLGLGLTMVGCE